VYYYTNNCNNNNANDSLPTADCIDWLSLYMYCLHNSKFPLDYIYLR